MSAWGLKHRAERKLFSEPLQRTQCGYSVVRAARKTGQPCLRHHAVRGPCCSVAKLCPTLCDPMDYSLLASLSFTISWSLLRLMSLELVILSNHLILCCFLLLLLSIFPASGSFPKSQLGGRGKDGGGIGREHHFLPHKFLKRTFKRRANFTKQLL